MGGSLLEMGGGSAMEVRNGMKRKRGDLFFSGVQYDCPYESLGRTAAAVRLSLQFVRVLSHGLNCVLAPVDATWMNDYLEVDINVIVAISTFWETPPRISPTPIPTPTTQSHQNTTTPQRNHNASKTISYIPAFHPVRYFSRINLKFIG